VHSCCRPRAHDKHPSVGVAASHSCCIVKPSHTIMCLQPVWVPITSLRPCTLRSVTPPFCPTCSPPTTRPSQNQPIPRPPNAQVAPELIEGYFKPYALSGRLRQVISTSEGLNLGALTFGAVKPVALKVRHQLRSFTTAHSRVVAEAAGSPSRAFGGSDLTERVAEPVRAAALLA
jgi:hypothetical protein